MFVGLDGFHCRVRGGVKASDITLLLSDEAGAFTAGLNAGDHTYLILDDGVNQEVVRYDGTPEVVQNKDGIVIKVTRGLNGTKYNFSSSTVLYYGFCTQVIRDILADTVK